MTPEPYYSDDAVTLYHGELAEVLPSLGQFAACVTDPPYGQTGLTWDRWVRGWADVVADHTSQLWCFGTFRLFLARSEEFARWRFAQDVVWTKTRAVSRVRDRFRRQHELVTHWYHGPWGDLYRDLPRVPSTVPNVRVVNRPAQRPNGLSTIGDYGAHTWVDDGKRYLTSVIEAATLSSSARKRHAINSTQKPLAILEPLIEYSVPVGGVVLDPFAGSASTGIAARNLGRRAVLIEAREEQCETAAERLSQQALVL